jgi:hypothetical protein
MNSTLRSDRCAAAAVLPSLVVLVVLSSALSLTPRPAVAAQSQAAPPETGTLPEGAPVNASAPTTPDASAPAPGGETVPAVLPTLAPVEDQKAAPVVHKRIVHRRKRRRSHVHVEPAQPVLPPLPPPVPAAGAIGPKPVTSILGKKVVGPKGEDLGRVVDVLVNDQGDSRAAVIDFGGFLGVGNRKIAVDWTLLQFKPADANAPVTLHLSREQIQQAPEFKDGTHPAAVLLTPQIPAVVVPTGAPLEAPPAAAALPAAPPTGAPPAVPIVPAVPPAAAPPPVAAPPAASLPAASAPAAAGANATSHPVSPPAPAPTPVQGVSRPEPAAKLPSSAPGQP